MVRRHDSQQGTHPLFKIVTHCHFLSFFPFSSFVWRFSVPFFRGSFSHTATKRAKKKGGRNVDVMKTFLKTSFSSDYKIVDVGDVFAPDLLPHDPLVFQSGISNSLAEGFRRSV